MGLVTMQCPNCGANFEMNDSLEFGICNYCGTKIAIEKTIIEHRGTVNVKGVADTDAILDRALLYIEDGKYAEAKQYCERALDLNPRNHDAYIMKLMAQTECVSREKLAMHTKPLYTYDSYQKAVRFAPQEIKQQLTEYNKQTIDRFETDKKKWLSELSEMKSLIDRRASTEKDAKKWTGNFKTYRIALIIASIILTLLLFSVSQYLAIIGILLFIAGLGYITVMRNNGSKFLSEHSSLVDNYTQKEQEFQNWLNNMQRIVS